MKIFSHTGIAILLLGMVPDRADVWKLLASHVIGFVFGLMVFTIGAAVEPLHRALPCAGSERLSAFDGVARRDVVRYQFPRALGIWDNKIAGNAFCYI